MNGTRLPKILLSILDRPACEATDHDLSLWLMVCDVMERRSIPDDARQDWAACRTEVETEINRRIAIKAIAHLASFKTAPRGAAISRQPSPDGASETTSRYVTSLKRG